MDKAIKFRIKELIAERERKTGENVTYKVIHEATRISPNTLSTMAQNKVKKVGISVIERLLDYFDCDVSDLIVYE